MRHGEIPGFVLRCMADKKILLSFEQRIRGEAQPDRVKSERRCLLYSVVVIIPQEIHICFIAVVQNNVVTLNFTPVMQIDTFDITATGFNCIPYHGKLYIVDPTSLSEQSASGINLAVSPNPVNNIAVLTFDLANSSRVNVFVTDAKGKLVQSISDNKTLASGKQQIEFSTNTYAKGTYFIHLVTGGKESVLKMVK